MKNFFAISILSIFCVSSCDQYKCNTYEEEAYVFGTIVKFTINDVPEEVARQAVRDAGQEFQQMHNEWNAWKAGELETINAAIARGEASDVSDFVLPVIMQSKELFDTSEGLFNPAIGGIIEIWGFHNDELPVGSIPAFEKVRSLAALSPTMDDVWVEGNILRSSNTSVQFDFGGFGKGLALDRAEQIFADYGIENAVINAGGDLNTMGNPTGRGWKVGIRHPVHWGAIASVELNNGEELYTSGNYERFVESEGIRYAHIIDPRNGMPVEHIVSASVIHDNGAVADAAATALTIAGPENWYRVAKSMGIEFALLVDDKGRIFSNPEMLDRVKFETDEDLEIVVSKPLINIERSGV